MKLTSIRKKSTEAAVVPVTVETRPLTSIYKPFDLFLAYGLSILFSSIAAVNGLHAFLRNHGSYQNIFSTFLRVTRDPHLGALVVADDTGADPLPQNLRKVRIRRNGEG
jgi:hypothetical protein